MKCADRVKRRICSRFYDAQSNLVKEARITVALIENRLCGDFFDIHIGGGKITFIVAQRRRATSS